jgi:prepilin-type N-terminal cleavage/methylation domain-containing protein
MKKGFTLVEVLIATILLGLAIAALIGANVSFTKANGVGANLSTAEFLAEQIRELSTMLAVVDPQTGTAHFGAEEANVADYDDIDDLDGNGSGLTFNPPISSSRTVLTDLAAYSQQVTVTNVNKNNFQQNVADNSSDFVRITVKIFYGSSELCSNSWIRARY